MAQTNTINNLDNNLLNRDREEEGGAAGKLREERRGDEMTNTAFNMVDASGQRGRIGETGSARDWAGAVRQAARIKRQAQNLKEQAGGKLKQAVAAPINQATSKLLQQAWINLLDSFGLTLIWINIHVFLRFVVGEELFCKLGDEWLPKLTKQTGGLSNQAVGRGIGLLEVMVLLILDLIVLGVIFTVLALIVIIVRFMQASWWEKTVTSLQVFWDTGWTTTKALYDLFVNAK